MRNGPWPHGPSSIFSFIPFISCQFFRVPDVLSVEKRKMSIFTPDIIDAGEPMGNSALTGHNPVLILNSRQSKNPVGAEDWIRVTVDAVRESIETGHPVIASVGMNTWELILWAVGEYGGDAIVLCPEPSDRSRSRAIVETALDFELVPEKHAWMFIEGSGESRSKKAWWRQRDRLAFDLASRIIPVSMRTGGRLESMMKDKSDDSEIDDGYRVEYRSRSHGESTINLPSRCPTVSGWSFLTHWTSRSNGPWPGERSSDYYRAIFESGGEYSRSAYFTLLRILDENRLRASGDHIRGNTPVVAFTALQPSEAIPLMRWRKRYVRPTFEPYGIAIHDRAAPAMGIKPVIYIGSNEIKEIDHSVDPVMVQGYGVGDWPAEKEWRAVGDIDLSEIPADDVIVLVPTEEEASAIREITRFRASSLEASRLCESNSGNCHRM